MQIVPIGRDAALVEVGGPGEALALAQWARGRLDVTEIVPAAQTVLFDGVADPGSLAEALAGWEPTDAPFGAGAVVEVPVRYDGRDLSHVAELWEMTTDEVVATHTSGDFVVAFNGFAPGFAYLTGLPPRLAVPRLDSPRPRVDAGSVGLAGSFTGIYPTASPGGWQVIGRTDAVLWDQDRPEPALLPPGTPVRFVAVP